MSSVIGYKEWDVICEALGSGRQSLLLRKGGIHEGRAGFSFKHEEFVLFPTKFHAQGEQVRVPYELSGGEWEPGDEVPIRYRCEAVWARTLTDWDVVQRLEDFHVWSDDLVRERFDCGEEQQIHCALVRVSRVKERWAFPYEKKFGGCRTWVEIPGAVGETVPVLDDEEFAGLQRRVEEIVGI